MFSSALHDGARTLLKLIYSTNIHEILQIYKSGKIEIKRKPVKPFKKLYQKMNNESIIYIKKVLLDNTVLCASASLRSRECHIY